LKKVRVGKLVLGNGRVYIQSMTNTDTADVKATVEQIYRLEAAGCEMVRVAVYDMESARRVKEIKSRISIPLIADVHFDHRVAIEAIRHGADKIRLNPGNIGEKHRVEEIARCAGDHGVPIRVGANAGSIKRRYLDKYPRYVALAESALDEVRILEKVGFHEIVVSVKSSDVVETVQATRYVRKRVQYPLHIGLTEAGVGYQAIVKSSIALGTLLMEGIGDTIRVSLTGDPVNEVKVARAILGSLGLKDVPQLIACPTCARVTIDVEKVARLLEKELMNIDGNFKVAVMGCVVNGPGEAADADIGMFGVKNDKVVVLEKGKSEKFFCSTDEAVEYLLEVIRKWKSGKKCG